ncbi:hypothetical protein Tco_1463358 [Tanacetum coccineum]
MASMNTRLNIEKLDGNIIQKHGGSKQVGLKQLGSKQVGFKQLGVKQVEFKQLGPGVETGVHESGMSKVFWAEDTTRSTYLVNMSPSSAIGFKKPIDMLGVLVGLLVLSKGCLNVLYRNTGFNESGEYKKTFIGSSVGTSSMKVLHGFKFEVEPLGDHTFEVEPQENVDQRVGLHEVQTQDLMDYQLARHRDQHLACELFGYREDSNEVAFAISVVEKIYAHKSLTFNDTVSCEVISKWKA